MPPAIPRQMAALILLTTLTLTAGCASDRKTQEAMRRANPTPPPAETPKPAVAAPALPGNQADLKAALAEPSAIAYQIQVIDDDPTPDVTTYFDSWLERGNAPTGNTLLLAVFSRSHYDIRFALGPALSARHLSVDDLLSAVRSEYLPAARDGDPAQGLARLVRAVNQKLD